MSAPYDYLYGGEEEEDPDQEAEQEEDGREMSLDEAGELLKITQQRSGSSTQFAPPPSSNNPAQVIALTTSLKGLLHAYSASIRLQHFLNCKRIRWINVDTNKDVILGRDLGNSDLIKQWEAEGILLHTPDGRLKIPQCIIDGVSVGDDVTICELEVDGDFDHVVNRTKCPGCLSRRQEDFGGSFQEYDDTMREECENCGKELGPIIPRDLWRSSAIHHVFADMPIGPEEPLPPPGTPIPYTPQFKVVTEYSQMNSSEIDSGFE